jgi:sugar lactone lactonase YvrE
MNKHENISQINSGGKIIMTNVKRILICLFVLAGFVKVNAQAVKLWETGEIYKGPESTVYDSHRDCLYISNYTGGVKTGSSYGDNSISKADLQGNILEYDFVKNLTMPTGICIFDDKLYIVERFGVVIYDLSANKIADKIYIKTSYFLNDITVDTEGGIYVSESDTNVIYRIKNKNVEKWMDSREISRPNGVLYDNGKLIVGVNSDNYLKAVNIADKKVTNIALLGPGIIDGIKKCGDGYLVSHYLGNLYLVKPSGEVTELINTRDEKTNIADFEYIADKQLIVIPALANNKLLGYKFDPTEKTN